MPPPEPSATFPRAAADPGSPFAFSALTDEQFRTARAAYESSGEYSVAATTSGGRFIIDNHLRAINAAAAYARGATGAGETVVIADSGFYQEHREFSGAGKFTLGESFGEPCTAEEIRTRACSDVDHGTSTAGVAAARRATESTLPNSQGVAFDANIIGLRVRLAAGRPTTDTAPPALTDASDTDTVNFYERLLYQPVDSSLDQDDWTYDRNRPRPGFVINMSFGLPHGIDSYTRAQVREFRDRTATLFAQGHRAAADRTILVWSAGNQNDRRYAARPGEAQGDLVDATSPTLNTALGVHFDLPHVLVVVSVQQNGRIAPFSNRCGTARAFCIAAPGVDLIAPQRGPGAVNSLGETSYPTDSYRTFSGTSAAAPVVTGALAVMRSFFRNPDGTPALGNTELATRLLATADRTDRTATGGPDYSDSDTYGHGLVDLDAATRPVGSLSTAMHGTADARPVAGTALETTGTALGTGLADALGGLRMAVFDELGAPFFTDFGKWVRRSGPLHAPRLPGGEAARAAAYRLALDDADFAFSLRPPPGTGSRDDEDRYAAGWRLDEALLRSRSGWWTSWNYHGGRALGLYSGEYGSAAAHFDDPAAFAAPYLSLVRGGAGLGFARRSAAGGQLGWTLLRGAPRYLGHTSAGWTPGLGMALDYRPARGGLSLQAGMVREAEGFLGARPTGALGAADGTTLFVGVNGGWEIGRDWRALAAGYLGRTRPGIGGGGLLRGVSELRSSAFSLGLVRRAPWRAGAWLGLRVTQPLRLESGAARLRLASGRTRYGEVLYRDHRVELAPQGRELELEAAYRTPVRAGKLSLSLTLTRHPGQDRRAGMRPAAWLVFQRAF
ncbi:MAG: S8 family serine peptidase [Gammaproteobacteria bacterium]|nr:S8 family serine peptidase [Gammaproteobacteria bacterium]